MAINAPVVMNSQRKCHIITRAASRPGLSMNTARPLLPYPPEHFLNRELTLLQFQRRVLAQAADPTVPLLERLRFLCIVSSNLDEFFEIRVSGIKEQIRIGSRKSGEDGIAPPDLLERVSDEVHEIISEQYALLNDDILPALEQEGVVFPR